VVKRKEVLPKAESQPLGIYLANVRGAKRMTLREVEEATNREVSNAYLSQLENGRISKPSPNILHSLAKVYGIAYEVLMEKAGYITVASSRSESERHGRIPTFAHENLTAEEEEELLKYLAFLRSRRGKK
jgi:HTH-type transcriptional regulator, competence development regulator